MREVKQGRWSKLPNSNASQMKLDSTGGIGDSMLNLSQRPESKKHSRKNSAKGSSKSKPGLKSSLNTSLGYKGGKKIDLTTSK